MNNSLFKLTSKDLAKPYPIGARKLHKELKIETRFNDWIERRISTYSFEENQDYIITIENTKGRSRKNYFLSLDMAKELCMVENNEIGRKMRRYFIEVEKKFRAIINPRSIAGYKGMLAVKEKRIKQLEKDMERAMYELGKQAMINESNKRKWLATHSLLDLACELEKEQEMMRPFIEFLEKLENLDIDKIKRRYKNIDYFLEKIKKRQREIIQDKKCIEDF